MVQGQNNLPITFEVTVRFQATNYQLRVSRYAGWVTLLLIVACKVALYFLRGGAS